VQVEVSPSTSPSRYGCFENFCKVRKVSTHERNTTVYVNLVAINVTIVAPLEPRHILKISWNLHALVPKSRFFLGLTRLYVSDCVLYE
jgi:hypothetical protein